MAINYARPLPEDKDGIKLQEFPANFPAIAVKVAVTDISSVFSFNDNTTTIEVAAPNGAMALKWIAQGASQTSVISSYASAVNLDHVVPGGTYRRFVLPKETQGKGTGTLASGSTFGLYNRMAVVPVSGAISSVIVTEY